MPETMKDILSFITESNKIEGIIRTPTKEEIAEYERFMALTEITILDMEIFVRVYQPDAKIRDKAHLNVRVGNHAPRPGGMGVVYELDNILSQAAFESAYTTHQRYEHLHPFTDGNGRSGRMLWKWKMREAPLGFLQTWYYNSLDEGRLNG